MSTPLRLEAIDAMWAAYQQVQTVAHVVATTGHAKATAEKYVHKGDPARGIVAFKDRLQAARRQAEEKADYDLVDAMAEDVKIARALKLRLAQRIRESLDAGETVKTTVTRDTDGNVTGRQETREPVTGSVQDLEALIRVAYRALGGPDAVVEMRLQREVHVLVAIVRDVLVAHGVDDAAVDAIFDDVDARLGSGEEVELID